MEILSETDDKNQEINPAGTPPYEAPVLNLMRLEKIRRWLKYGSVLVLLAFLALIGYSWMELQKIEKDIAFKRRQREQLEQEIKANQSRIDAQKIVIESQRGGLSALQQTIDTIVVKNPEQEKFIRRSVEQNMALNATGKQILPRIYIQIASEEQRPRAAEVVRALQAKGFIAPGIENMQKKPASIPPASQLRYYDRDEVSKKDLQDIAAIIGGFGVTLKPTLIAQRGTVRARHYEIWFDKSFGNTDPPSLPDNDRPAVSQQLRPAVAVTQAVIPNRESYQSVIEKRDFTGTNRYTSIKNSDGQELLRVRVVRANDDGITELYFSSGREETAHLNLRINEPGVQYLQDKKYRVSIRITSYGRIGSTRVANYTIRVEQRADNHSADVPQQVLIPR